MKPILPFALVLVMGASALPSWAAAVTEPPRPDDPLNRAPAPGTNSPSPKIQFATLAMDFGKVDAGAPVKFTYVFTNVGAAALELTRVQASCPGCTTIGQWTHKVEPGQTGVIPVELNTSLMSGPVTKTLSVTCNDPAQPSLVLQLHGTVWKPVEVIPPLAFLRVPEDSPTNVTVTVRIVNHMDSPLILSPPESETRTFTASLVTNQPGKEFGLVVKAVGPLSPGAVTGKIHVKTLATNVPVITVPVLANLVQAAGAPSAGTPTNAARPAH